MRPDLGRGRPRRGGPQRRRCWSSGAAPAAVCAVVKADGYGHGAVPVAGAALDGGRDLAGRGPGRGGGGPARGRASTPRSWCSPRPGPTSSPTWLPSTCGPPSTPTGRAWRPRRPRPAPPLPAPPQGRHRACTGSGPPPTDAVALAQAIVDDPSLELEARVDPLRRGRRARATRSPPSSSTRFDDVARRAGARPGIEVPAAHAANSAGAIAHPRGRRSTWSACGIAVYGVAPSPAAGRSRWPCGRRCACAPRSAW